MSTDPTEIETPKRRAPRWMKWTLGVSLALNLVLIGLLIGAGIRHHVLGEAGFGGPRTIFHILRELPSEKRDQARAMVKERRADISAARRLRAEARGALGDAIAADPYDAAAVSAAFETLRTREYEMRSLSHSVVTEILADIEAEERRELGERLQPKKKR